MKNKERQVGLIMTVIISAVMGLVASFFLIRTNPESVKTSSPVMLYVTNTIMSLVLGLIISFILPFGKMGSSLARKCGANPPSLKFILINAVPLSVGNTVCVSLILSLVGVLIARRQIPAEALKNVSPFPVMWLGGWAKILLPTLFVSYLLSVILAPIVAKLVGFPKGGPGGPPSGVPKDK